MNFSFALQKGELFGIDSNKNKQAADAPNRQVAPIPRYYRQRLLLRLTAALGENLVKTDIQKFMFLFMREFAQKESASLYEFIPYVYGCYSFACAMDIQYLLQKKFICINGNCFHIKAQLPEIKELDARAINRLIQDYGHLRAAALVNFVAKKYPDYEKFSAPGQDKASLEPRTSKKRVLFTIGYEGISFERYIHKLIDADVHLLCDVRAYPVSHKLGFSKQMMERVLPKIGIVYMSMPDLGVPYEMRQARSSAEVISDPFALYRKELRNRQRLLTYLERKIEEYGYVAITCFEKLPQHCHRHCISEAINGARPDIQVQHL